MHIKPKKIAFSGICLAMAMIFLGIGGVLGVGTLFFLMLAAFLLGAVEMICGRRSAVWYFVASVLLAFILAAEKLHVMTYGLMELYLLLREAFDGSRKKREHVSADRALARQIGAGGPTPKERYAAMGLHLLLFILLMIPVVLLGRQLFAGEIVLLSLKTGSAALAYGLACLYLLLIWGIFETAYDRFRILVGRLILRKGVDRL